MQPWLAATYGELSKGFAAAISTPRTTPTDGAIVSVGWAVAHALAHAVTHLGHIQLTRQLWEQSQR